MTHEQDKQQDRDYILYMRGKTAGDLLISMIEKRRPGVGLKLLHHPAFLNGLEDAWGVNITPKDD